MAYRGGWFSGKCFGWWGMRGRGLFSKRVTGAGLDVTNPEPLPKGHALWKFDNVVITPHIAGQSDNVNARQMELFKENIAHFVKGEQLVNVVDKQKGY